MIARPIFLILFLLLSYQVFGGEDEGLEYRSLLAPLSTLEDSYQRVNETLSYLKKLLPNQQQDLLARWKRERPILWNIIDQYLSLNRNFVALPMLKRGEEIRFPQGFERDVKSLLFDIYG